MPVGATEERDVDVRFIAATNRNLKEEVDSGAFRSDLFYRLHVIPVHLPLLREREGDIPILADHFARKFAAEMGRKIRGITPKAMARLCKHDFPGNVRELENIIERAVALCTSSEIDLEALPDLGPVFGAEQGEGLMDLPDDGMDLDAYMGDIEQRYLKLALERTTGNRTEAATLLQLTLRSLRYRLAKFGIDAGGKD